MKPGREVLDPLNRRVIVVAVLPGDQVQVRLKGPYGVTVVYPRSLLKELP